MGIYGTVSYIVVLRTREIGIHVAVGAQKSNILRLILRESTRPVFAGLFVGVLLSVGSSHVLHGILYGLHSSMQPHLLVSRSSSWPSQYLPPSTIMPSDRGRSCGGAPPRVNRAHGSPQIIRAPS